MKNEMMAVLLGMLVASAGTYSVIQAVKPAPPVPCTASDKVLDKLSELIKQNGNAVNSTQNALTEQLRALNALPGDKQEALKVLAAHQSATLALQDEKKRLEEQGCKK